MTSFEYAIAWLGAVLFVTGTVVVSSLLLAMYFRGSLARVERGTRSERRH